MIIYIVALIILAFVIESSFQLWILCAFNMVLLSSHLVMSDSYSPIDCSMPGSSVLYYLPEFAQIHVY